VHLDIIKFLLPTDAQENCFQTCQIPNSAADIHQQGPDNICSHTARLNTPTYFNWLF